MAVRLLELEELSDVLDLAQQWWNENYADNDPFKRQHFHDVWERLLFMGDGLIFVEYDGAIDRGCFGCVRDFNMYTGRLEYEGRFLVVKKEYRGGPVLLNLFTGIHDMIKRFGEPCAISFTSRTPEFAHAWSRLGYVVDAQRLTRRIEP